MNKLTSVTVISGVLIASIFGTFTALIVSNHLQISSLTSLISHDNSNNLSNQVNDLNSKMKVLYGQVPDPVHTNQIIIPPYTTATKYCDLRYSCVEPYIVAINVGESITWINQSDQYLQIFQATDYDNIKCTSTNGSVIGFDLSSGLLKEGYSHTVKFTQAGQYHWCATSGDSNINGIIIVKEGSPLL